MLDLHSPQHKEYGRITPRKFVHFFNKHTLDSKYRKAACLQRFKSNLRSVGSRKLPPPTGLIPRAACPSRRTYRGDIQKSSPDEQVGDSGWEEYLSTA